MKASDNMGEDGTQMKKSFIARATLRNHAIRLFSEWRAGLLFMGLLGLTSNAFAELRLPLIFTSHMVLQQQLPVRVRGWANPGDEISVDFAGQHKTAKVNEKGLWKLELDPLPASAESRTLKVSAKAEGKTIELTDVLVGEVWVCSGQSNMGYAMDTYRKADPAAFTEALPNIRSCTVPFRGAYQPQSDYVVPPDANAIQWVACEKERIPYLSATAFYFGRELQRHLKVPVGLIVAALGGTPVECWTPRSAFDADDQTRAVLARWEKQLDAYPEGREKFEKHQQEWLQKVRDYAAPTSPYGQWWKKVVEAEAAGKPRPPMPADLPPDPGNGDIPFNYRTPTTVYNATVAPLNSLTIRGVIWYQGEGGTVTFKWDIYGKVLSAMIPAWRRDWGLGDFPFLIVQLPYYTAVIPDANAEHSWASCREEQRRAVVANPNAAAVVTFDTGNDTDIHPANKDVVGARLALAARALAYHEKIVYQGPVAKSAEMADGKVRVRYDDVGGGLVTKGEDGEFSDTGTVKGFGLAGADGKFVWVDATIDGKTILINTDKIPQPAKVRYGWANHPVCNLFNREGLPAGPFELQLPTGK